MYQSVKYALELLSENFFNKHRFHMVKTKTLISIHYQLTANFLNLLHINNYIVILPSAVHLVRIWNRKLSKNSFQCSLSVPGEKLFSALFWSTLTFKFFYTNNFGKKWEIIAKKKDGCKRQRPCQNARSYILIILVCYY